MSKSVGDMTMDELRQMLEIVLEHKLLEFLGDPDEGLELREEIQERLTKQREAVAAGERGLSLEEIEQRFRAE